MTMHPEVDILATIATRRSNGEAFALATVVRTVAATAAKAGAKALILPDGTISAGWIEAFDVETGRSRVLSRKALRTLSSRTRSWQDEVARMAKAVDLDVLRIGVDEQQTTIALSEFIAERRLRKAA